MIHFPYMKGGQNIKEPLEAHCLISNCVTTLETNLQKIDNDVKEKLPKVLNDPEGNVAQKTFESVKMIEWAVSRLIRLTKKYDFGQTDLQSCMTFDVEHFHATTHYKTPVITILQHCRSFGYYQIGSPTTLEITVAGTLSQKTRCHFIIFHNYHSCQQ